MAYSAIRYQKNTCYIQDSLLGEVLKSIFIEVDNKVSSSSDKYGWLMQALNRWWGDFEDFPPGLKDIELDEWLVDAEKRSVFEEILILSLEKADEKIFAEILKFKTVLTA
ncbi:hypothetical protein CDO73_07745 [Saccharibacillus sp. O23]|uniref:hypothetical protein n=1 Tax=Saccharibacillus sp. O23 TaxID=2009338 RepID=UPI000B4E380A|nr:hypothetical protein [Saccharibacillus sp. O23]OWR31285.1 hypothetical protein CDO73_07745 [Saccharibacillus sp. O23]